MINISITRLVSVIILGFLLSSCKSRPNTENNIKSITLAVSGINNQKDDNQFSIYFDDSLNFYYYGNIYEDTIGYFRKKANKYEWNNVIKYFQKFVETGFDKDISVNQCNTYTYIELIINTNKDKLHFLKKNCKISENDIDRLALLIAILKKSAKLEKSDSIYFETKIQYDNQNTNNLINSKPHN